MTPNLPRVTTMVESLLVCDCFYAVLNNSLIISFTTKLFSPSKLEIIGEKVENLAGFKAEAKSVS